MLETVYLRIKIRADAIAPIGPQIQVDFERTSGVGGADGADGIAVFRVEIDGQMSLSTEICSGRE
jgi:hypothetical protein